MLKLSCYFSSIRVLLLLICVWCGILATLSSSSVVGGEGFGSVVKREERRTLVSTEYGEISAVRVTDNINGSYLLHFFTLDPNSLFLPVILHADMVFYVHTGSGKLSWTEEDELKSTDLRRGDAYSLQEGAVFFIQSNLETETERQKLRIHAIFANSNRDLHGSTTGPYSSIRDMVLGFDKKVLQAAFMVPEEDIEELLNGTKPPAIIHGVSKTKRTELEMEAQFIGSRTYNIFELNKKKKKAGARLFNLFKEGKDFENCNGWSTTVTRKKLSTLKGTNIGLFMVNLTTGSMMGPHWNPMATEIAVVLQGRGMVRVVCSGISNETGWRNMRYEVEEGDVFAVPRFHAMAQMAFNNETLVFMGFSSSAKRNYPQFLAGQASVFRALDKDVLGMSFNVTNTTMDQLLASQQDSVILRCISCAEEELRIMEEEREKEREAAREREEEEARERGEERRREEEEARKREEEEARRQEEERKRREEEEEEAARRREEEEERKRQEEEAARREEEERKRREEEAARRWEEEEERKRQEEEAARREEEERRRREEEEAARRREEEEERKRQEEEARKREEEAARREEEERKRREEEEEEAARREEEERQTEEMEEQEARRREEKEARQREQQQQKAREREEEEETKRRREQQEQEEEEEAQWRRHEQEEEARRREEEEQEQQGGRSEEEQAAEEERRRAEEAEREEEATRRHEGEQERRQEVEGGGEEEEQEGGSSRGRGDTKRQHENQGDEEWGIILNV